MSSNSIFHFLPVVQCIAPGLIYCTFTNMVLKTELLIYSWVFLSCLSLAYVNASQRSFNLSSHHFSEVRRGNHPCFTTFSSHFSDFFHPFFFFNHLYTYRFYPFPLFHVVTSICLSPQQITAFTPLTSRKESQ